MCTSYKYIRMYKISEQILAKSECKRDGQQTKPNCSQLQFVAVFQVLHSNLQLRSSEWSESLASFCHAPNESKKKKNVKRYLLRSRSLRGCSCTCRKQLLPSDYARKNETGRGLIGILSIFFGKTWKQKLPSSRAGSSLFVIFFNKHMNNGN